MLFIRLFFELIRVLLDSLEAPLRPDEHLDRRTPRGTSRLFRGNRVGVHHGGVIGQLEEFASASISIHANCPTEFTK
jgi:hypothetical protein